MSIGNKHRLQELLDRKHPRCYYCKQDVYHTTFLRGKQLHNTATVDHRYPKTDIRRNLVTENRNTVLCCYECNQSRNIETWHFVFDGYKNLPDIKLTDLIK